MPRKLLLIDSDPTLASEIESAFTLYGYMIDHAADADSGLVLIEEFDYEIIVVEVALPRRCGLDVLESMRARGVATPVVVVTSHAPAELRVALAGFTNVRLIVPKPVEPAAFASLVDGIAAQ